MVSNVPTEKVTVEPVKITAQTTRDESREKPTRKPMAFWMSFIALNTTTLIVSLDSTALAVAIPKITSELDGTTLQAFWTNIGFVLAQVICQPIYTTTSDILGRKIPLYAAFLFFFVGSVVFASADTMPILIVGRMLQGIGAGGLDVLGDIILSDLTTLKERPIYLGLYTLPMAVGAVCGPLFGAGLSEFVSWRWIGWVNLPMIGLGVVLTFFFMNLQPVEATLRSKVARLDWIGMILLTLGSTFISLPLSWAGAMFPWSDWRTIIPLIVGLVIVVLFCLHERNTRNALFPARIFGNGTAIASLAGAAVQGALLGSIIMYLPLFFQAVKLQPALRSAVSVLPFAAFIIASSVLGAIVIQVMGKYRPTIIFNHALMTLGIGLWALWRRSSSNSMLYVLEILPAIGNGVLYTAINLPMTASVRNADDMGLAAGVLSCFRLFGAMLGLAISSSVFTSVFQHHISLIGSLPYILATLRDVKQAIGFIPSLSAIQDDVPADVLQQVVGAYAASLMAVFLTLMGIGAVGFILSWFTRELSTDREELGRQSLKSEPKV